MADGFDDETVISGVIEETTALARRTQLRKDILAGQ
jgi:hypothetical protein